jgi:hypothetical protein
VAIFRLRPIGLYLERTTEPVARRNHRRHTLSKGGFSSINWK